jgi:predicted double-glycine peptidase
MKFKHWLEDTNVPDQHIDIDIPPTHQQKDYSCGAACLRAISTYFKVGPKTEQEFMKDCNTKHDKGTHPENLERVAKQYGLSVQAKKNMTLSELQNYLKNGVPVICVMQAWGDPKDYHNEDSGHYVVAIGFNEVNIYFMDPLIEDAARGHLSHSEFVKRWHDHAPDGEKYIRFGIAMWKNVNSPKAEKLHTTQKIK